MLGIFTAFATIIVFNIRLHKFNNAYSMDALNLFSIFLKTYPIPNLI